MNVQPDKPRGWPEFRPQIMLIGEAPSDEEAALRRPFVGPSGRVLNGALRTANIERAELYITNVFDRQAPGNDVSGWMRDPEIRAEALARLTAEINEADPAVIVPLGGTALWALTGETAIMSYRGTASITEVDGTARKIVPSLHPAAVIKQWKMLPVLIGDLSKAAAEAKIGRKLRHARMQLLIEPTVDDVEAFVYECLAADLLSVDIETGWGMMTNIGFAPTRDRALNIPLIDTRKPSRSYWRTAALELRVWKALREILGSPVPKLMQNGIYDIQWLVDHYNMPVVNYRHDTRLMHHALFPELPKSLEFMAATYTNIGVWKTWGGVAERDKRDA